MPPCARKTNADEAQCTQPLCHWMTLNNQNLQGSLSSLMRRKWVRIPTNDMVRGSYILNPPTGVLEVRIFKLLPGCRTGVTVRLDR
jgi:hypothetical protein